MSSWKKYKEYGAVENTDEKRSGEEREAGRKALSVKDQAQELYDKTNAKLRAWKTCAAFRSDPVKMAKIIETYLERLNIVELESYIMDDKSDGVENEGKELLKSKRVRIGLQKMVDSSVAVVDLFRFFDLDCFGVAQSHGPTRAIEQLMSTFL